jgi:CMP-N,N'-diacetyllegionaminic acid synthase
VIGDHKVIAVVPARAGSKSVPDKNIRNLAGKPLISWTLDTALATPEIDRVIVSTDGNKIADIARRHEGVEVFDRPADLASDTAMVIDTIHHVLARLTDDGDDDSIIVLLEPTTPGRHASDIRACLELLVSGKFDSIATFVEARLNPRRAWTMDGDKAVPYFDGNDPWLRRQDLPVAWQLNGAVYAFQANQLPAGGVNVLFGDIGAVIMPRERSFDIDDETDFEVADVLIRKLN